MRRDIDHLRDLQAERATRSPPLRHRTRSFPRRHREVIDGGALRRHGMTEIGIAGYPDGHPRISQQHLDRALADKINAAETTGMGVHIVTQLCFDPAAILNWIGRLRGFGIEHEVRIGLAGPTNLATLLRYAKRCGVRASAQGLARQTGLMRQLFAMSAPDVLVRALAQAHADGQLGQVAPHFFSLGQYPGRNQRECRPTSSQEPITSVQPKWISRRPIPFA